MTFKKDFIVLRKPYYLINIILSLSYLFCKKIPFVCGILFPGSYPQCELDSKETEILFFLLIVVMIKTKKSGSVTMVNYFNASFIYNKIANIVLWFYADVRMGIIYTVIVTLCAMVFPEPTYSGPENVVYFRTAASLEEQIEKDQRITWLVVFYTAWNPACVSFAPVFAELSAEYGLENLKFGKIDIGRYPDAAKKYNVNDSPMSRQLPTLVLFKDGKEVTRRPGFDNKGKVIKFFFSADNVKASFDLNNIYNECKSNPLKKRKPVTEQAETSKSHLKSD